MSHTESCAQTARDPTRRQGGITHEPAQHDLPLQTTQTTRLGDHDAVACDQLASFSPSARSANQVILSEAHLGATVSAWASHRHLQETFSNPVVEPIHDLLRDDLPNRRIV